MTAGHDTQRNEVPNESIPTSVNKADVVIFDVLAWPEVDLEYRTVLLRLPGGYETRLSPANAQRLGQRLNEAGGGSRG